MKHRGRPQRRLADLEREMLTCAFANPHLRARELDRYFAFPPGSLYRFSVSKEGRAHLAALRRNLRPQDLWPDQLLPRALLECEIEHSREMARRLREAQEAAEMGAFLSKR